MLWVAVPAEGASTNATALSTTSFTPTETSKTFNYVPAADKTALRSSNKATKSSSNSSLSKGSSFAGSGYK